MAGGLLGINTAIVMPRDAPRAKMDNTRRLGGEVITYDRYNGDREAIARAVAEERSAELVPSYDHDHIIAGQGTVGLEIAEQAGEFGLSPDQALINCGGGGLSSGSAVALKDTFSRYISAHGRARGVRRYRPLNRGRQAIASRTRVGVHLRFLAGG